MNTPQSAIAAQQKKHRKPQAGANPSTRGAENSTPAARRLYEYIALEIEHAILRRELRPGDRLLPERELAERYSASRVVVREALHGLQVKGLIEVRHGSNGGYFVGHFGGDLLNHGLRSLAILGQITVEHLSELRIAIEPEVARLAAARATDQDIADIRNLLNKRKAVDEQGGDVATLDLDFHRKVANASRNPLYIALLDSLMHIEVDLVLSSIKFDRHDHGIVDNSHHEIFEAIASRRPEEAARAMHSHTLDLHERKSRGKREPAPFDVLKESLISSRSGRHDRDQA